jgi:hypothetical protein
MSLGVPAVTLGGGGEGGNWHSLNEWYKPSLSGAAKRAAHHVGAVRIGGRDPAGAPDTPAETIMKRALIVLLLALLSGAARGEFNVVEISIMYMQQAMAGGITSRALVQQ